MQLILSIFITICWFHRLCNGGDGVMLQHDANEVVVYAISNNSYYLYDSINNLYNKINDTTIAMQLGFDATFKQTIPYINASSIDPSNIIGKFISNKNHSNVKSEEYYLDELHYFNQLFRGNPVLIQDALILPRYFRRVQNCGIVPIFSQRRYHYPNIFSFLIIISIFHLQRKIILIIIQMFYP